MKIGFDMDETVAELNDKWLSLISKALNISLKKEDLLVYDIAKNIRTHVPLVTEEEIEECFSLLDEDGFFEDLELICGSKETLELLKSEGNEVEFCSYIADLENAAKGKVRWLKKHFPGMNYTFTTNKASYTCDVFVDDKYENLINVKSSLKLLMDRPHNRRIKIDNRVTRCFGFLDVYNEIKKYEESMK